MTDFPIIDPERAPGVFAYRLTQLDVRDGGLASGHQLGCQTLIAQPKTRLPLASGKAELRAASVRPVGGWHRRSLKQCWIGQGDRGRHIAYPCR
jgi:hypothetical protein